MKSGIAIVSGHSLKFLSCPALFMTFFLLGQSTLLGASGSQPPTGDFVYVEGGSFNMGAEIGGGDSDEMPAHPVSVASFYLSKFEVTQQLWVSVMGGNPSYFKGPNRPMENVSWYDCVSFCNKYSMKLGLEPCYRLVENGKDSGTNPDSWPMRWNRGTSENIIYDSTAKGFRLPTEVEWEYAAKGGKLHSGYTYSGSNEMSSVGWFLDNSDGQTHDVGQKQANGLGIFDMSGNVREWCWDWHKRYPGNTDDSPHYVTSLRVLRGGSWNDEVYLARVPFRSCFRPSNQDNYFGLRLAVSEGGR